MAVLRRSPTFAVVHGLAVFLSTTSWTATSTSAEEGALEKAAQWQPYCGVYCAYAALRVSGKSVKFQDLLRPEYIESGKGSSIEGLGRAIQDMGLRARALGGMTTRTLRYCPHMTILHVKPSLKSREYTHFVLCYRVEENGVNILDPPYSVRSIPFNELAGLWDGKALVIGDRPIRKQSIFARERIHWIIVVGTILCAVLVIQVSISRCGILGRSSSSWVESAGLSFCQAMILGMLVVLVAPLFHLLQGQGLLANDVVVRAIQKSHAGDFIPKFGVNSMERLLRDDVIFVDARFKRDFEAGHLEGAISVPVNATDEERQATLVGVAGDAKIVVYCQSAGCPFAKKVAVRLKEDGFSNVSIFKGGWNEWSAKTRQEKESHS